MANLRLLLIILLLCSSAYARPLTFGVASVLPEGTPDSVINDFNDYLSEKMGRRVEAVMETDNDKLNSLLKTKSVDFASVCTHTIDGRVRIIAIPEINGRHSYITLIIAGNNTGIKTVKDLKNRTFAFTDGLTGSGSLYPAYLMIKEFGLKPENVLKKIFYTKSNEQSIYLVQKGVVEAAAVDGGIYISMSRKTPKKTAGIGVIHKSPVIIAPPIIASDAMPQYIFNRLRRVLLNMHKDNEGKKLLKQMNMNRFIHAKKEDYQTLYNIRQTVENFGKQP